MPIGAFADPTRIGRSASYAHLVMVAGIVVIAAGEELVVAHPSGHLQPAWIAVILGGPALFVVGRAGLEYSVFGRVSKDRLVGLLVLAALAPAMFLVPPLVAATTATAVLAGIAVADASRAGAHPREAPSPPGGSAKSGSIPGAAVGFGPVSRVLRPTRPLYAALIRLPGKEVEVALGDVRLVGIQRPLPQAGNPLPQPGDRDALISLEVLEDPTDTCGWKVLVRFFDLVVSVRVSIRDSDTAGQHA